MAYLSEVTEDINWWWYGNVLSLALLRRPTKTQPAEVSEQSQCQGERFEKVCWEGRLTYRIEKYPPKFSLTHHLLRGCRREVTSHYVQGG